MILVTCQNDDCSTPHFYVDVQSGKFPLTISPETPAAINIAPAQAATAGIWSGLNSKLTQEISNTLTQEEQEEFLRTLVKLKTFNPEILLVKNRFKEIKDVTDYLVVHCESNHRNYIPLTPDKEIYNKKQETDNE